MDLALLGLAALFLLGGKKGTSAPSSSSSDAQTSEPDLDALRSRAASKRAQDWIPHLVKAGASPELAAGLARWIGIESSGNPLAVSPIGERGLLQSTKTTALKEKLFTQGEWDALTSPNTTPAQHAKLALKQFGYHVTKARKWVANPPPLQDVASWLYYGKAHHTRPADMTADKMHGPASMMAVDLAKRHANGDTGRKRRMFAATVVAFGGLPNV